MTKRILLDHTQFKGFDTKDLNSIKSSEFFQARRRTKLDVNNQHADDDVYVSKSQKLQGHQDQLGLYAARPYKRKDVIIAYLGKAQLAKRRTYQDDKNNPYVFSTRMYDKTTRKRAAHVIDAKDNKTASAAKFANAADYVDELNASFVTYINDVYLVAFRDIAKGEELLTSYGRQTGDIIRQ